MMRPDATLRAPGPDVHKGPSVHAFKPADYPRGMQAYRLKTCSSRSAYAALPPGRALTTRVARPFPSAPCAHIDNFCHLLLVSALSNSVSDNSEYDAGQRHAESHSSLRESHCDRGDGQNDCG